MQEKKSIASYIKTNKNIIYLLNRIFTFRSADTTTKTLPRFVVNISLCYLLAYGLAKPIVAYALSGITKNAQENIAMVVGMCL